MRDKYFILFNRVNPCSENEHKADDQYISDFSGSQLREVRYDIWAETGRRLGGVNEIKRSRKTYRSGNKNSDFFVFMIGYHI